MEYSQPICYFFAANSDTPTHTFSYSTNNSIARVQFKMSYCKKGINWDQKTQMSKEEFLALAALKYEDLSKLNEIKDFYTYEKGFDQIWTDLGKQVLEKNISKVPADRRKKSESDAYALRKNNCGQR